MIRYAVLFIAALLFAPCQSVTATESTVAEQLTLPPFTLSVPALDSHREYLGLKKDPGADFSPEDIDADILLIELFSMYCPFCQEEAPAVNELYKAMENVSTPDMKVRIIGIGANNSEFEVDHFRSTYEVPFPLFPDPDMKIYELLQGKGTPGFVGCKKEADGSYTIILTQSGGFHHYEDFLAELLAKSGK